MLGCRGLNSCLAAPNGTDTLSALMTLRKVCNHPALLARGADDENEKSELIKEVAAFLPSHLEAGKYEETVCTVCLLCVGASYCVQFEIQ